MKTIVSKRELKRIGEWSSQPGRKLLLYHNDPDGICSAAQWLTAWPDFEPIAREGPVMQPGFVRWLADQQPDVLVFLDLPVDQEAKKLAWLQEQRPDLNIIVIDHHIPDSNLGSSKGNIIHVNNKFIAGLKGKYLPAAWLVYIILEDMGELEGKKEIKKQLKQKLEQIKWVAGAGIIGDYGQKDCAGFFKGMKGRQTGMKVMEKAADLISAAVTLKGRQGADRVLKILLREARQGSINGFVGRSTLQIWKGFVDTEVKKTLKEFKKEGEEFKGPKRLNVSMFRIRSKLNIVSVISTILSEKHPNRIILIYKLSHKGMWKVSGRLQSGRRDLGTLFKKAVKGIGTGGGHRQAAGARVKDWERFKRRVMEELGVSRGKGKG